MKWLSLIVTGFVVTVAHAQSLSNAVTAGEFRVVATRAALNLQAGRSHNPPHPRILVFRAVKQIVLFS